MTVNLAYLYLLSPLHTGGTSQEGNLVGIARESHTNFPYLPSSTIRGRLRAATPQDQRTKLWGNTIEDVTSGSDENLKQGTLWVGDGGIIWFPVPSLSHGVVWVTCPFLLKRWLRFIHSKPSVFPDIGSFSTGNQANLYLRDAIFKKEKLKPWSEWSQFIPTGSEETNIMTQLLVLSNQNCRVLIESSLWRQVKVRLDETKTVQGGFRYEEAIPPETLMYFPSSTTAAVNGNDRQTKESSEFKQLMSNQSLLQLGGQESLGRGFVRQWLSEQKEQ